MRARWIGGAASLVVFGATLAAYAQVQLRCGPAGRGRPSDDGTRCECVAPAFVEQVRGGTHRCVPRPARHDTQPPREESPCGPGEHRSAGRCCAAGHEWVPSMARCTCVDPSVCGPRPVPSVPECTGGRRWDASASACACPPEAPHWNGAAGRCIAPCVAGATWNAGRNECVCDDATPDFDRAQNRCVERRAPTCPEGMVLVPAGTFWLGSPGGEGNADEHPQLHVRLNAYCVDRTEVTVRAYRACVEAGVCAPQRTINFDGMSETEQRLHNPACNLGRDGVDDHPINCVDWTNASAFCRWRDARLPTEAEWEHAARGNDGRTYPWGNAAPDATLLNACGAECVRWGAERGQRWGSLYPADDGWPTTAPVGSFPRGASPYGALDMAGNVWEWTADWYVAGYNYTGDPVFNPTGATTGTLRSYRGGGLFTSPPSEARMAYRTHGGPALRRDFIGFRCARGAM